MLLPARIPISRFILFFISFISFQTLPAQKINIDSLRSVIRSAKQDTASVQALNILALHLSSSNPDTSILLTQRALQIAEKHRRDKDIGISYHQLGLFYWRKGDYLIALENFSNAIAVWQKLESSSGAKDHGFYLDRKARALCNMGIIFSDQADYPKAMDHYFRALRSFEELGLNRERAVVLLNLGIIFKDQKEYSKALEYFFMSLKILEELNDKFSIAVNLINIGIVCEEQGDSALYAGDTAAAFIINNGIPAGKYPNALEFYLKALKISEEINDKANVANILGNMGVVYDDLANASRIDSARNRYQNRSVEYYLKAIGLFEELGAKRDVALNYCNLGAVEMRRKNYSKAEKHLQRAAAIADSIGALTVVTEAEKNLSDLYERTGQSGKALDHYKKYISARDTVFNEENLKKQTRYELNYEFDKKTALMQAEHDKQASLAAAESRRQKIIIWFVAACLLLTGIIAIVIFRFLQVSNTQKKIIAHKNKEITDSINYAVRIQQAKLPRKDDIEKALPQSFILYKPKDIVSGDFYWIAHPQPILLGGEQKILPFGEDLPAEQAGLGGVLLACCDCTGHGIPGAFVSMIGSEKLNDAAKSYSDPGEILAFVNREIRASLRQSSDPGSTRDGMDVALIHLNLAEMKLHYAGANRPLWVIRKSPLPLGGEGGGLVEFKPTKKSLGGFTENDQVFETHEIHLEKGDTFYMFSDGYADQNGGEKNKKLMTKNFKQILISIQEKPMKEQGEYLDHYIESWRGVQEQVDDVLVIGVKVV